MIAREGNRPWSGCRLWDNRGGEAYTTAVYRLKKRPAWYVQPSTVGRACSSTTIGMQRACRTPPFGAIRTHTSPQRPGLVRVAAAETVTCVLVFFFSLRHAPSSLEGVSASPGSVRSYREQLVRHWSM